MSKFPTSLVTPSNPSNTEGEKADWKIKTAANGLLFYFNTKTKKSQWEKPDILKTPEELLNSTDWQEHTTAEGKAFYYNAKLKQSVWRMPPELKAIKEKQAELQKQLGQTQSAGSKINISITSNIPNAENPQDDATKYDNLSHEEAARVFMDMLRETVSPTMKWEQILPLIKNDERMKVIKGIGDQRRLFKEWVGQTRAQERQEFKQRIQRARDNFRRMLQEKKVLDSDSKYYKVFHLFMNDPRWKALEDRDREQTFQEYLDDLYEEEKEKRNKSIKQNREELRKQLMNDLRVTPFLKWDEVCQLYKDNSVWNDLPEFDRLQVFSKWIIELDHQEHENKRRNRRAQERKNREAFRELLKEYIERGALIHKTKWRHFVHLIKEEKRLIDMLGQNGSTPRELYEDQIEILKDQYRRTKDDFKKLLKETDLKITSETTLQQFQLALKGKDEFDKLELKNQEYFYNYFVDKAKSKEKEGFKKYKKSVKRFIKFVKGLPDINPESEYRDFEKMINENEQFAIISEVDKIANFSSVIQDMKNQDEGQISDEGLEKHRKKRTKKRKKNKKKTNDSSDNEDAKGDSSDESTKRSGSKSDSKSQSREQRKKKKDRKKIAKSQSDSEGERDVEKHPEKKIFTEKNLAIAIESQNVLDPNKGKENQKEKELKYKIQEEILRSEAKPKEEVKLVKTHNEKERIEIEEGQKFPQEESKAEFEDREEGETKESAARGHRSVSRSSRSESRDKRKKKKDRKHNKKKNKKGDKDKEKERERDRDRDRDRKSKKKHRKRSYSRSESSDDD